MKKDILNDCNKILYYNKKYFDENISEISDFEYDILRKKLEKKLFDRSLDEKLRKK